MNAYTSSDHTAYMFSVTNENFAGVRPCPPDEHSGCSDLTLQRIL